MFVFCSYLQLCIVAGQVSGAVVYGKTEHVDTSAGSGRGVRGEVDARKIIDKMVDAVHLSGPLCFVYLCDYLFGVLYAEVE